MLLFLRMEAEKEFRRLVGYEKTEELKPGEKEMLNIVLPAKAFASFLEEQQEWRIQAGAYGIWIGNSLSEAKLSAGVKVSADVMMEKTKKLEDHSEVLKSKTVQKNYADAQKNGQHCLRNFRTYHLNQRQKKRKYADFQKKRRFL